MTDATSLSRRRPELGLRRSVSDPFRVTRPEYTGRPGELFWLAFLRMLLTIVTLGVGRFWMQTRLRRYYWSSIRIMGEPLEYTGTAIEKLMGFLIAVVILAAYLGLAQLILAYLGLSYFQGNPLSLQLSVLALLPLGFWAQYRARRYLLARTRWSGIRFGMAPGAWGYMVRACFWWLLTILSLGLLYPLLQMKLARFTTDRTYFGTMRFEQRGGWGPLFVTYLAWWLSSFVIIAIIVAGVALAESDAPPDWFTGLSEWAFNPNSAVILATVAIIASLWLVFLRMRYEVFSFRYLSSNKWLGANTHFDVSLSVWTVIGIYIGGGVMIAVISSAIVFIAGLVIAVLALLLGATLPDVGSLDMESLGGVISSGAIGAFLAIFLVYFLIIALGVALTQVFLVQPMFRAVSDSTKIFNAEAAAEARQRPHDDQIEAGGFADALGADIGGI